jgi:hypothetical protein
MKKNGTQRRELRSRNLPVGAPCVGLPVHSVGKCCLIEPNNCTNRVTHAHVFTESLVMCHSTCGKYRPFIYYKLVRGHDSLTSPSPRPKPYSSSRLSKMSSLKTASNVSQPSLLPTNNVEAMFQQIMHAVHKSVSGRVVVIVL